MKIIDIGGKKVEIYDSIDELPVYRFHRYSKMLLVDSGVGSGLDDVERHMERAICYARSSTPELAAVEIENLRQNIHFIHSGISPAHLAFAALVKSIDGKPCDDLSDEGLQSVVDQFNNVSCSEMTARTEAVKKKIDEELRLYFPKKSDDAAIKEYYDMLRNHTLLQLESIYDPTASKEKELKELNADILTYFRPQTFYGVNSAEINFDRCFEMMCLSLSHNLHVKPKEFTVLEYYSACEYLKEMNKEMKKLRKK